MEFLEVAEKLALKAGDKIMEFYESDFDVEMKEDDSPLTQADLESDRIIMEGLKKEFPEHGLLTEESEDDKTRLEKEYVWIVDPLDGTKEFISKNGEFTVNIALVKDGEPVVGVVYAPAKEELYSAARGEGAFLTKGGERKRITASEVDELEDMTVVASRSHMSDSLKRFLDENEISSIDRRGSSLKGCMVAQGDADLYPRFGPQNEWDFCAMDVVIRESGGEMTDLDGKTIKYNSDNPLHKGFIVSNGNIHDELTRLVGEHGQTG